MSEDSANPPTVTRRVTSGSKNPTLQVTTVKLNGKNYLPWSQSFKLFVKGEGLMGYLLGTTKEPKVGDTLHPQWELENSTVMSWLLNSMELELSNGYLFMDTAKEIWDAVSQTYSHKGNMAQIYELKCRIHNSKQRESSVAAYFHSLRSMWQKLDFYQAIDMDSPADALKLKKLIEQERIIEFLAGLNGEYDPIIVQILGKEPLPSLHEVYAYIQHEESRREVMHHSPSQESSALVTTIPRDSRFGGKKLDKNRSGDNHDDKDRLFCDFCNKYRHDREHCWKLHGRPVPGGKGGRFGGRGGFRANHTTAHQSPAEPISPVTQSGPSSSEFVMLTKDEVENFRRLMSQMSTSTAASSAFAHSGNNPTALSASCHTFSHPWIIDSGASDHMTGLSNLFSSYITCSGRQQVKIADGSLTSVSGKGSIPVTPSMSLSSVLHVPNLSTNLLSVSSLTKHLNCSVTFFPDHCVFQDLVTKKMIGSGRERAGLYLLDSQWTSTRHVEQAHKSETCDSTEGKIWLLHRRLGHVPFPMLKKIFPLFCHLDVSKFCCEPCEFAKHHRVSFPISNTKSVTPFVIIHTDVWGPSRVVGLFGFRWFVTFIDDCSRVTWVYLMKDKSDVFSCFQTFHKMVLNQFDARVKIVRSDNGGEYFFGGLKSYFTDHGIIHQHTCSDTPQQNGVAERKNRHLLEVARALRFSMNVPKLYWPEAVLTAAYLINRMPSRVLDFKSPIEVLFPSSPALPPSFSSHFLIPPRVFGCVCFVHIPPRLRSKHDPRALKCIFLGYSPTQKGYKCYHPSSGRKFVSMDVTFHENLAFFPSETSLQGERVDEDKSLGPPSLSLPIIPNIQEQEMDKDLEPQQEICVEESSRPLKVYSRRQKDVTGTPLLPRQSDSSYSGNPSSTSILEPADVIHVPYSDLDLPIALRKGARSCARYPISNFVNFHSLSPSYRAFVSQLSSVSIPQNVQDALKDPKWKKAMCEEMNALKKNDTWELVELPDGKKPVGCKWVFTVKHKADGSVERYKARLVAKGFTQTYGIDYQDTFAPVAKMNSIRVLLSLAANMDWPLQQLDVKNAFLHGDLEEEVYMDIPPGFPLKHDNGKVCRLRKSLYGLKQSPRAWFGRFSKAMLKVGYHQSQTDHTLFIKHSTQGKVTALIVYVDDIILTGNDVEEMMNLKTYLAKEFEIKDLGELKYFLGIEVARSRNGIFISQRKYVLDLLKETGMLGCKPIDTPIDQNHRLGVSDDDALVEKGRYQRLVGRLIYLSHTRPDLAYAVGVVSQFMHSPRESHMEAVYRILRYLKSAPGRGILFSKHDHLQVEAYTDADWAGSVTDRRSTSGYCTFVGGNLVTWRSKKQSVVARSSAEAEFRAMAHGVCELLWLKSLLKELGFDNKEPMKLYCDNKAAINIAHNPVQHDRTKHVEVDRHFIKEKLDAGVICTPFVKTGNQLADILTKGVPNGVLHSFLTKLGIRNIFAPT